MGASGRYREGIFVYSAHETSIDVDDMTCSMNGLTARVRDLHTGLIQWHFPFRYPESIVLILRFEVAGMEPTANPPSIFKLAGFACPRL